MSRTILIECSPRRPSDGVVVPVRLVFKSVARANFLGVQWHPAVETVPAFESSLGFDGRSFGDAPSPQIGDLEFALTDATRYAGGLVWANAAVTMRMAPWTAAGGDPADGDFTIIWSGLAEGISAGKGRARVRLLDNGQAMRVPALAAKFGSTGDALLDSADALKDRSADTRVPRAWGKLLSIPGILVDRANGIWLFAGNAATSVQAFYDGGAALTLGAARANLAALQANAPASGTVDYCLDAGGKFLARNWTTPVYPFTAAATFGSTTAADIASAIVTSRTAVTFTAGTVAAFNTLQSAENGLYLDDDTSVAAALDRLFAGLGAWWRVSSAATITLGRWAWTAPALTGASHRRHAPDRLRIVAPTRRRSLGYAPNDRVHSEAEIARILLAGDLAYADGTSIEALKPGQAGADVTSTKTAAAIASQGVLATRNRITLGSGEGGLTNQANDTWLLDVSIITTVGTAAGITGQSFLATNYPGRLQPHPYFGATYLDANLIAYDGPAGNVVGALKPEEVSSNRTETRVAASITGQGSLAVQNNVFFGTGNNRVLSEGGAFWITNAVAVTIQGTAAGITGQGTLATRNRVQLQAAEGGLTNQANDTWLLDVSIITTIGIASGFVGQGALASANSVDYNTQVYNKPAGGGGQVTVGNGQDIKKYLTAGQQVVATGGVGATGATANFGDRYATLVADGTVFATGAAFNPGPFEPSNGDVSGTYTHSGASRVVSFYISYSGAAIAVDDSLTFITA